MSASSFRAWTVRILRLKKRRQHLSMQALCRKQMYSSRSKQMFALSLLTDSSRYVPNTYRPHLSLCRYMCSETRPRDEKHKGDYGYEKITYDIPTPPGQKKDTSIALPKKYSPEFVEAAWYDWWVKQGFFKPEFKSYSVKENNDKFVLCLPPPNVTGTLHLGHALTNSIQDAIVRWNRMKGRQTLWIPGCDHAGIATQVVVEKQLMREENLTRHEIGREEFMKRVWKWKEEKGDIIYNQMKQLGSSLDWDRACFTMDDNLSTAVTEAFVRLHDEGLIFREKRMVNWCCHLKSAISDIEVDQTPISGMTKMTLPGYDEEVMMGTMATFSYPIMGSDEKIAVSTTRPETMLGDTAVAIHPEDSRYIHLHGKCVHHPLTDRTIPIICDTYVEKDFGTGAVKITPAHDPNDFEIGKRHNLPVLSVISDHGVMENVPAKYLNMKRFDARKVVIQDLVKMGLFEGTKPHEMVIPVCSRSKDIIEPKLKDQWFLNCKELAEQAIQVVQNNELKLIPKYYEKKWFDFLTHSPDWCLSRQIWWGHRLPVYQVTVKHQESKDELWVSARNINEARSKAAARLGVSEDQVCLQQDEDVLDTWFSSALFPFSPLGWPNQTADLKNFYPTELLETGNDIMLFWVIRMVMLGLKLTGQVPFKEVLLHGTIRDAYGRKMSKSLGNIIDPADIVKGISLEGLHERLKSSNLDKAEMALAMEGQTKDFPNGIPECGTDGLRFCLCSMNYTAQTINLNVNHMKNKRHFCNKIMQGTFHVRNLGPDFRPAGDFKAEVRVSRCIDKWILSRLSDMVMKCNENFEAYSLHMAADSLFVFWMNEFCPVYLESVKYLLAEEGNDTETVKQILYFCVDTFLRSMSPFMPYLTEELYQRLPGADQTSRPESICISQYPSSSYYIPFQSEAIDQAGNAVKKVISAVMSTQTRYNLKKETLPVMLKVKDDSLRQILAESSMTHTVQTLSNAASIEVLPWNHTLPTGSKVILTEPDLELHGMLRGVINKKVEVELLEGRIQKLSKKISKYDKKSKGKAREKMNIFLEEKEELERELTFIKQLEEN